MGQHALLQVGPQRAWLRHRHQRDADHAGHRRRRGEGAAARRAALRGGRLRHLGRLSHGRPRQGARAHDRHQRAHARRSPDLPRRVREGGSRAAPDLMQPSRALGLPRRRRDAHRRDARLEHMGRPARDSALHLHGRARRGTRARAPTSSRLRPPWPTRLAVALRTSSAPVWRLPGPTTCTRTPRRRSTVCGRWLPAGDRRQPARRAHGRAACFGRRGRRHGHER